MHSLLAPLVDFRISSTGALIVVMYGVLIGGAVGSFLNVVAYRLPLGMNLSRPGSRCPKCTRPIRPWHNIPVLGWLLLRGRCRDCGAPISPRYPVVELMLAVASGVVVWKSLMPVVEGDANSYSLNVIAVALRLALVYLLFTSALLEFDGHRLPVRLNGTWVLILTSGALLIAEFRPPQPLTDTLLPAVDVLAFPAAAAVVLGLITWPLLLRPPSATMASAIARFCLLFVQALTLGGLAVMFSALATAISLLVIIVLGHAWPKVRRLGWASMLLLSTLLWILVASPHLGSNELAMIGGTIIIPGSPWQTLEPIGLLTSGFVVLDWFADRWFSRRERSTI
jgi:prepilin signal peptidase PulO-like enzyme (type II secretory pathway)